MAFMMPVVKNDWDIYNSQKSRRPSEGAERGGGVGRVRKVSECRSEGPAMGARAAALSPHRSAPAMRSLSYSRPPTSRTSLRAPQDSHSPPSRPGSAAPPRQPTDKFHNRARAESPPRSRCACVPYL